MRAHVCAALTLCCGFFGCDAGQTRSPQTYLPQSLEAAPRGFLMPIGGGASAGNDGVLKPAQIDLHSKALETFRAHRSKSPELGQKICVIEYHEDSPETRESIALVRKLFIAAGADDSELLDFVFDTREKADSADSVAPFARACGLVVLPGGDQTLMRDLWQGTRLKAAMDAILAKGGGIMGKSAGAALQGSVGFFPLLDSDPSTGTLLKRARFKDGEVGDGFFKGALKDFPALYVETHAGDRERTARALALMAVWHERGGGRAAVPSALVVDSDTGMLITFSARDRAWVGEVIGARVVETLTHGSRSQWGVTVDGKPFATHVLSHVLLSGAKVVLSGAARGTVLQSAMSERIGPAPAEPIGFDACLKRLPRRIDGRHDSDARGASEFVFDARDPATGEARDFNAVEYAYLTGDLTVQGGNGCGHWFANAFDADFGRPENRLNAQRFAVARSGIRFAVAVPPSLDAAFHEDGRVVAFEPKSDNPSSAFIIDARTATRRAVGRYVYRELGARGPVQTGGYQGATVHLLSPGSHFDLARGDVTRLNQGRVVGLESQAH